MHTASVVQSCGASFVLLGPRQTQIESSKPVIAVTAVRTGAGKSPLTRWIARHVAESGRRPVVIRHPMPYGDLEMERCQRFATQHDLDRNACTIEEREEYQPYLELGLPVFAGVDYETILREAKREADVVLWDGGNNDFPFIKPGLLITVTDALRPGHELRYYPGETNLRMADVVVINKVGTAARGDVALIREHVGTANPDAEVILADLEITVEAPEQIAGRRVLIVEDGPTLTHGEMPTGAGFLAARRNNAAEIIDPRPFAVGTIALVFDKYAGIGPVLPAMGYSNDQIEELNETVNASDAELILDASPAALGHLLHTGIPIHRVSYEFRQIEGPALAGIVGRYLSN
jgi:predicted GTPase